MKKLILTGLLVLLISQINLLTQASSLGTSVPITQNLEVSVGQSQIIRLREKPERISLSNPGIAYVLMITPDQIEIIGRNPGRTNLYFWFAPKEKARPGSKTRIIGSEISVGLPKPAYNTSTPSMEIMNGDQTELLYLGNPPEQIYNSRPARPSGPATDMPETCLMPGCL